MKLLKNQHFDGLFDRGENLLIEDAHLDGCSFSNCGISLTKDVARRSTVRRVFIENCTANQCSIGPSIFEDVSIKNLGASDLLIFWGALFKRVLMEGGMGKIKINHYANFVDRTIEFQRPFDEFRVDFYSSNEWALDISRARFEGFDARGIPAKLFRRDPESQLIVTRERALSGEWRKKISASNTLWPFMIDLFLSDGDPDMILVAPLGAPKKKRDVLLQGLQELRRLDVAEPD